MEQCALGAQRRKVLVILKNNIRTQKKIKMVEIV